MPRGRKKVIIKSIEEQIVDTKSKIEDLEHDIDTMELKLKELETKKREQDLAALSQALVENDISVDEAIDIIKNNVPNTDVE